MWFAALMVSRIRTEASGEDRLRTSAISATRTSSSASATALQIKPHCSAFVAGIRSPSNARPKARARPTRNGRFQVVPISGTMPKFGPKVATKNAECAATEISQAKANPNPPPAAAPFTLATVGTGHSIRSTRARLNVPPSCSESSLFDCWAPLSSATCCKSAPAQKPRPAPVSTTTRTE